MMRRPHKGFTLIEAAVVLAVLAVLLSLALPSFGGQLSRHRLVAAAEHLAQDMAEARFQAAHAGQALYVRFETGPDWCYAVARTSGCGCHGPQPCQIKTVRAADVPGVTLTEGRELRFDPVDPAAAPAAAELVSARGDRVRVGLSPLGRAQLCALQPLRGVTNC